MVRKKKPLKEAKRPEGPIHPWRVCPYGQYWRSTHPLSVPPSESDPDGSITTRHGHCVTNPSTKDQLYPQEIQNIARESFKLLKNYPCPDSLKYPNGNDYDDLIAGWTQYWNDVLKPSESLDPNLVKALIASESSFDPNILYDKKKPNSARGLIQITNDTRKILGDEKGELKDHYVTASREELNDPNVNICAGIRWLMHKQVLASRRLGRNATWMETIYDYKGLSEATETRKKKLLDRFLDLYEQLQKCGK